jgi:hypothetical protein
VAADTEKKNRVFLICRLVHLPLAALIGAGAGLLLSLLFYPAALAINSISVWQTWQFVFQVSGLGGFSAVIGGLVFGLLFFRPEMGRFAYLKGLLFSLLSLIVAAVIYGFAMHQYKSLFVPGYQACLFFFTAAVPWLGIGGMAVAFRGWIMRRRGQYGN